MAKRIVGKICSLESIQWNPTSFFVEAVSIQGQGHELSFALHPIFPSKSQLVDYKQDPDSKTLKVVSKQPSVCGGSNPSPMDLLITAKNS